MKIRKRIAILPAIAAMAIGVVVATPANATDKEQVSSATTAYGICTDTIYIFRSSTQTDFASTALNTYQPNACGFAYTREYFSSDWWSSWGYGSGDTYGWYSSRSGNTVIKSWHRLYRPGLPITNKYLTLFLIPA